MATWRWTCKKRKCTTRPGLLQMFGEHLSLFPEREGEGMRITIEVTQQDIGDGKQGSIRECAIALAVKRYFPECTVSVDSNSVVITARHSCRILLPGSATKFVRDFDHHKRTVSPFSFDLVILDIGHACRRSEEMRTSIGFDSTRVTAFVH